MSAAIALGCACAFVFVVTLVLALRKGKDPLVAEAARLLEFHYHGTSARGKYRGLRFVIDAGSPEELRCAGAYGSFVSSATSAADGLLKRLGACFGLGRGKAVSLRMRVELRSAGGPAFDATPVAAGMRKFLAGKLDRGKFRAKKEETELTVFLHDLGSDDISSGAALLKEVADRAVNAAETLRKGER